MINNLNVISPTNYSKWPATHGYHSIFLFSFIQLQYYVVFCFFFTLFFFIYTHTYTYIIFTFKKQMTSTCKLSWTIKMQLIFFYTILIAESHWFKLSQANAIRLLSLQTNTAIISCCLTLNHLLVTLRHLACIATSLRSSK